MSLPLTTADVARFEIFLQDCLAPLAQEAQADHRELCARVVSTLERCVNPNLSGLTESDYGFLESWLKARDLIVAGLQVLEMADPASADAVKHERECTETAFDLLPQVIDRARRAQD